MQLLRVIVWLLWPSISYTYRILGVFPLPNLSHFLIAESLMKGLISKGHQVDIISPFPQKKPYPNYTDIEFKLVKLPLNLLNNMSYDIVIQLGQKNPIHTIATAYGNDLCNSYLACPEIQELIHNPPDYDAVIIEIFGSHCFAAFAHRFKVPLIGLSTTSLYPWLNDLIAQPDNLAFVRNCLIPINVNHSMTLWQRTYNVLSSMQAKFWFNYFAQPQNDIVRKYFGPNMPNLQDIKMALILINSHITINEIEPMTPALVQIGGIHLQSNTTSVLSSELKKWMDDSKDGFVYFSFGSMVMFETFPREIINIFYSTLSKIAPVRVLMKIVKPELLLSNLPRNIHTSKWIPQREVLKHPNVRAFITHGGLMGTIEAINCGVPMIGIPLFADQFKNINLYVMKNIAVKLDIHNITEKNVDAALNAVLYNPRYKENVKNLSRKYRDRPLNPVDTANYWIEYVIKYGEDVLRSSAMDLTWWQICLVDVIACLLFCIAAMITVVALIVRFIMRMLNGSHRKSSQSKKNN